MNATDTLQSYIFELFGLCRSKHVQHDSLTTASDITESENMCNVAKGTIFSETRNKYSTKRHEVNNTPAALPHFAKFLASVWINLRKYHLANKF